MANNPTYAQIVAGQTEQSLFGQFTTYLIGLLPGAAYWGGGDPEQVMIQDGFAPLLSTIYDFAADIARGGFLRGALGLANANIAAWNTDPMTTFLGWLATEVYNVTPQPPSFCTQTLRVTNTGGPLTLIANFTVADIATSTLTYQLVGGAQTVPSGVSFVIISATSPGSAYNLGAGLITKVVTSAAGISVSNQPQPPSTTPIIDYGGARQSPASVVAQCLANWGRLSILQTSPTAAYKALALDSAITGTAAVRKVGVWQHFRDGVGQAANYVTLYLAGDAGPVTMGQAAQVQAGVSPYIGLCDRLVCAPCGSAAYNPVFTVYVAKQSDIQPAALALFAQLALLQQRLDIGATCYAFDLRRACALVPAITEVEDSLVDFVPAQNALVTLGTGGIVGPLVGP